MVNVCTWQTNVRDVHGGTYVVDRRVWTLCGGPTCVDVRGGPMCGRTQQTDMQGCTWTDVRWRMICGVRVQAPGGMHIGTTVSSTEMITMPVAVSLAIEEEESQQHGLLPQMKKKKPFVSHGLMKILSAVSTQMLPLVVLEFLPGIFALCATYNPLTHNLPAFTDLPSTVQLRIAVRMKTSSL